MSESYDVIVVGGGMGGATCAALLARRCLRTLLVDQNKSPGGKAMVAGDREFRYDLWPIVGGPSLNSRFAEVLDELEMADQVEILTPSNSSVLMYRGSEGDEPRSLVGSAVPDAAAAQGAFQMLNLQADDFPETARLFTDMANLSPAEIDALDDVSFGEFLARYRLPQSVLTYFAMQSNIIFVVPVDLVAASEMIRTSRDFTAGGAGRYHSGGFGHMAEIFCQGVERYGGRVLLGTRVERIRVSDGAVTGIDTAEGSFEAPLVVSNAGIQPTVLRLVGEEHFDRSYVSYVRGLVPSWGIVGIRYFLDRPFFEHGMYVAFSDENVLDGERFTKMKSGWLPDDLLVFNTVPSFYDPTLAPEGKQCAVVGTLCSPDPEFPHAEALWQRLDETVKRLWPGLEDCVERQINYGNKQVSRLTRDAVVPGQGGECIGLAQTVGQCGRHKPSAAAPLRGLYYVGCDAGGYGCGTHQAADSGVKLADRVEREHRIRRAAF